MTTLVTASPRTRNTTLAPDGSMERAASRYFRRIRALIQEDVQRIRQTFDTRIAPQLINHQRTSESRLRTNITTRELERIMAELEEQAMLNTFHPLKAERLAEDFVQEVNVLHKEAFRQQVSQVLGVLPTTDPNLNIFVDGAIRDNVAYIKSIPERHHAQVQDLVKDGLVAGRRTADIGRDIAEAGRVSIRRGRFIARDQLGSLFGNLSQRRGQDMGMEKFQWVTMADERVRESHVPLDGEVFTWQQGADGLFPGTDFNCRCGYDIPESEYSRWREDYTETDEGAL